MTNPHYNRVFSQIDGNQSRAASMRNEFTRIEQGFDSVESRLAAAEADIAALMAAPGGSVAVSVQRVALTLGGNFASEDATISAVDVSKSTIEIISRITASTSYDPAEHDVVPSFVSPTQVRISRAGGASLPVTVTLQIVEYA